MVETLMLPINLFINHYLSYCQYLEQDTNTCNLLPTGVRSQSNFESVFCGGWRGGSAALRLGKATQCFTCVTQHVTGDGAALQGVVEPGCLWPAYAPVLRIRR